MYSISDWVSLHRMDIKASENMYTSSLRTAILFPYVPLRLLEMATMVFHQQFVRGLVLVSSNIQSVSWLLVHQIRLKHRTKLIDSARDWACLCRRLRRLRLVLLLVYGLLQPMLYQLKCSSGRSVKARARINITTLVNHIQADEKPTTIE